MDVRVRSEEAFISGTSRRKFLRLAVLGGGAGLVFAAWPNQYLWASGKAEALLLSCMDFRLLDETEQYMAGRGLRDRYDHMLLAGASLGALTERYPAWNDMFWQHLDMAVNLHEIGRIILLDHRDCGAYKAILDEDLALEPTHEFAVHRSHLHRLDEQIREKYPDIDVELLLMDMNGSVEAVS